ncbi:MAG: phosphate ABC transporter permease PstA [Spirochaetota bacterium]
MNGKSKTQIRSERLDTLFNVLGIAATAFSLLFLLVLIIDILLDAIPRLNLGFLMSFPSRKPEQAGILAALVGSIWIMALTAVIAFPVGLAAGVYLEEYAKKDRLTSFIEININNLAGVPSIIYGLLGLGIFVRLFGLDRSVLSGALTLSLLVLPVIILTTREALRAVPNSIREAAYALGATRWQTVSRQVVPAAMGNILTGLILAISRAVGETAPLITIGALAYVAFLPTPPVSITTTAPFVAVSGQGFFDFFTVMPIQIFNWVSRPQKGFAENAAAGIIVLLLLTLIMNAAAIVIRYRFQKKVRW